MQEGILRVEHELTGSHEGRMRVIFFATPFDKDAPLKVPYPTHATGPAW
jgi:hypothetical protein